MSARQGICDYNMTQTTYTVVDIGKNRSYELNGESTLEPDDSITILKNKLAILTGILPEYQYLYVKLSGDVEETVIVPLGFYLVKVKASGSIRPIESELPYNHDPFTQMFDEKKFLGDLSIIDPIFTDQS